MNMSSYQPEQMGTALPGLEILNSCAQDTGSQLKFPHLPRKELEVGTAPGREPGQPRHSRTQDGRVAWQESLAQSS